MRDQVSIVDAGTGFEVMADPTVVAATLKAHGWTIFPPVTSEEALALTDEYGPLSTLGLMQVKEAQASIALDRDQTFTLDDLDEWPVQTALMTEAEASAGLDEDTDDGGAHRRLTDHPWPATPPWPGAERSQSMVPEPVVEMRKGRHRTGDHASSVRGARDIVFRAGSQRHRLLTAYAAAGRTDVVGGQDRGFTDEEAAEWTNLTRSCFWKRCGELREDGLIETIPGPNPDGNLTRVGAAGTPRIVCRITDAGRAYLNRLTTEGRVG